MLDSSDDGDDGEEGITLGDIPWPGYLPLQWIDRFPPKISLELRPWKRNPQYTGVDPVRDTYTRLTSVTRKREIVKVVPQRLPQKPPEQPVKVTTRRKPRLEEEHFGVNLLRWENDIVYDQPVTDIFEDRAKSPLSPLSGFQIGPFVQDQRNDLVDQCTWEDEIVVDHDDVQSKADVDGDVLMPLALGNVQPSQEDEIEDTNLNSQAKPMVADVTDATLWLNEMSSDTPLAEAPLLQARLRNTLSAPEPPKRFRGVSRVMEKGKRFDPSNMSRDRYYEDATMNQVPMLRQSLGSQSVPHSLPAVRLYRPYYKIHLTPYELRRYHRLPLKISPGLNITFSGRKKVDLDPATKMRGRNVKAKNLTVKDLDSKFVLFEYSEEYPPLMQKLGMACIIHWYWRKHPDKPNLKPPSKLPGPGSLFELEPEDASPFLGFGNVNPGELVPAIYNNLFRASLHLHQGRHSDFLVVRHLYKGVAKVHLRNIDTLFVVGQTLPLLEVPTPHARKVIDIIRKRLQHLVFQMCRHKQKNFDTDPRTVRFSTIRQFFPATQEAQLKIRLKEFADWGKKTDLYTLRPAIAIPTEDELRQLISPEIVCLYESMLVGQQMLQDAGYGQHSTASQDNFDYLTEGAEKTEMQSAPWNTTANFVKASQGKASLQLFGPGDPTGKAQEGFSFFKGTLKDMWGSGEDGKLKVAEQQELYREAIERIYRKQKKSLDNQDTPDVSEEEDEDTDKEKEKGRVLVIQRRYRLEHGRMQWRTEVIRDERVISVYLKRRRALEELEESMSSTASRAQSSSRSGAYINPLHDPISQEKQRLMDEISRLKKSKQRKLQREAARNKQMQRLRESLNQGGEEELVEDLT